MCTVTWSRRPGRFQLFFNRDERRTRRAAQRPTIRRAGSMAYIAPRDGDHGGSWISVNQVGLTVGLLNGYSAADLDPADYVSRGELPLTLAECRDVDEVGGRLERLDLERYRSFRLAAFEAGGATLIADWQEGRLTRDDPDDPPLPLVSSSFESDSVCRSRIALFHEMRDQAAPAQGEEDTALHLSYHASHRPAQGPHSVCMHRPDAETVSMSWIDIDRSGIRFHYAPHAPHAGLSSQPAVTLAGLGPFFSGTV